jgi:hypothetical protein
MGANFAGDKFNREGHGRLLSRDDFTTRYGDLKMKPRYELNQSQLADFHRGRIPDGIMRPRDWYNVGRPLHQEINITNININYGNQYIVNNFLPRGGRPDYGSFSWNYWDGRRFYDHSYAINLFIGLGHVRYGGYDGYMVNNRYYCYGYGWVDGCIDYGECRVWVPGFWSSYTVTECCDCQVWMEPVYETVWTGCCWETVQVDGGYFTNSGNSDCRDVVRYRWVPGHYQFYNA